MSTFISKSDHLQNSTDQQINEIIDKANALFSILGATGLKNVMLWIKRLAIYYIYIRILNELILERVVKNYNKAMDHLEAIGDGNRAVGFPARADADGVKETKFKWSSQGARLTNQK